MALRTRLATTRRARWGTVVSPTKVARSNEAEARMMVPQRLPASRDAVEKRAVAKARARPTMARRNRIQICGKRMVFRKEGTRSRVIVSLAEMDLPIRIAPRDAATSIGLSGE